MKQPTAMPAAVQRLMTEEVPADSRQARQLSRRQMIAETVMTEGAMRIEDLTDRFGISLMTVHRDLDELVGRGLLRKTRGVVSAAATSLIESSDVYRSSRQEAEKRAIALAAMAYVEPGQAIFFDDSTTVLAMAPHLQDKAPLTVITNSLTLMTQLRGLPELSLLGLGGQYHAWANAFMGRMTTAEIARLRADTLFLSMAAVTDDIVFHQSPEMVETKRAMFDSAARRILLIDHTKFERRALHGFAPLLEFDRVIVDDGIDPEHLERLRGKGIAVDVAPVAAAMAAR
ncbi:DeoR/GlpR family DNA-binding transcription regulator [Pseudoroseicyclus aestuarii]|nr:DeoR/GlpR family DNA-binding transcription regulator [Pseudoroseicyclus aestuarii]